MAWNTHQMQATLDRWRTSGEREVDAAILSHITPTGFDDINFDGVLAFSLEQHRARILPSSSPPEMPDRVVR
jgi:Tn3 transposase DDE domain